MIQRRTVTKDNAVSPVVGVMLMLVVTIIIAAVVAVFASGMTGSVTIAPQAAISASNVPGGSYGTVTFTHLGGDTISLNEIQIIFKVEGAVVKIDGTDGHISTPEGGSAIISTGQSFTYDGVGAGTYFGKDAKIEWEILDKNSGNLISAGSFFNA